MKIQVETCFKVTCGHCGKPTKYQAWVDADYDLLIERLREIIGCRGGETCVSLCCPHCEKEILVTSFVV